MAFLEYNNGYFGANLSLAAGQVAVVTDDTRLWPPSPCLPILISIVPIPVSHCDGITEGHLTTNTEMVKIYSRYTAKYIHRTPHYDLIQIDNYPEDSEQNNIAYRLYCIYKQYIDNIFLLNK